MNRVALEDHLQKWVGLATFGVLREYAYDKNQDRFVVRASYMDAQLALVLNVDDTHLGFVVGELMYLEERVRSIADKRGYVVEFDL